MATVDRLTEGLQELRDSIAQTAQAAPQAARQEIRREGRAYFRGAVVASVITSLLIGIPLFMLAEQFSAYTTADQARAAQLQASADDIRRLAQGAHDLGVQANDELTHRGLATVPIPVPGTVPDSQVLAAASTAQVAAKIAAESIVVPTPAQIRAEVAAQLAKLPPPPVGPAPQQITEAVQAYVAANSEQLRGPRGERGEAGKSPPCLAEPTQCQGAQGEPGPRGEPPVGWTVEEADGSTTSCQRADDFTVAAPRYRCSHAASTATSTTPSPVTTTEPATPSDTVPLPLPVG
ncbi:MAG TPA: hypothetical protein VN748_19495 [Pseudonocardiaceae bacterium]|jgi:hypothetical protein|nr:hypothetical protein [Pseudonocardiaceae bacterium]